MATQEEISHIIINKGKQADVARAYAKGLRNIDNTNWQAVNQMIVERWSETGLKKVKEQAWKIKEKIAIADDCGL